MAIIIIIIIKIVLGAHTQNKKNTEIWGKGLIIIIIIKCSDFSGNEKAFRGEANTACWL